MKNRLSSRVLQSAQPFVHELESRRLFSTIPANFVEEAYGLPFVGATSIAFSPDGRLFALDRYQGRVYQVRQSGNAIWSIALNHNNHNERGVLGIAFDPNYSVNKYVYLHYSELPAGTPVNYDGPTRSRISRFTENQGIISSASEQVIYRLDTESSGNHLGGSMNFGPDGKLYIATGDSGVSGNAQSLANRFGKVLRINADGTIPADNPSSFPGIAGTTSGVNRAIWAVGLHDPRALEFNPADGTLFVNERGGSAQEINLVQAGRNYGAPTANGFFNSTTFPDFTNPIYVYNQSSSGTTYGSFITGGSFYSSQATVQFPEPFQGDYFFSDTFNYWIAGIDPKNPPTAISGATAFARNVLGVTDIEVGPDGALYYYRVTGVYRIRPNPATTPSITIQPVDQSVYLDQSAAFSVNANGAGTLAYQWQRNGVDVPGANSPTYTIPSLSMADDRATFRVQVSNGTARVASNPATLSVTDNTAPVPIITAPTSNRFSAGQTVHFSGSATDLEDGPLSALHLSWRVERHGVDGIEPFLEPIDGVDAGSFSIPTTADIDVNTVFRIIVTATDSGGRSESRYRDLFPNTSTITLATTGIPEGALLELDGQSVPGGSVQIGVVGVERQIGAPSVQVLDRQSYAFVEWSNSGDRVQTISTPAINTTYTATYLDVTSPGVVAIHFSREPVAQERPPHEITLDFNEPATLLNGALTLVNRTTGHVVQPADLTFVAEAGGTRFTISPRGSGIFADGEYVVTVNESLVLDAVGNALQYPSSSNFQVLAGDLDGNGHVDFSDLLIVAQNYGRTGRSYSQGNVDYSADGLVGFDDLLLLAQRYGTSLVSANVAGNAAAKRKSSAARNEDLLN